MCPINCLDRHLASKADKNAIIFEGEQGDTRHISYQQLTDEVSQFANALKAQGIEMGDRVVIYMPMIPEAVVAMQACARIGAIHSVVFGGFSAESLRDRINDAGAKMVITADGGHRGGKVVELKAATDKALDHGCPSIEHVIVYQRSKQGVNMTEGRDIWWHDAIKASPLTAHRSGWNQNTPCSCSTPQALPANPKAYNTPVQAICWAPS